MVYGDDELLEEFDKSFALLMKYFEKFNMLDENVIEGVISRNKKEAYAAPGLSGEILVHGVEIDKSNNCQPAKNGGVDQ